MYYILNFVNSHGKEVSMKFDDFLYFSCSNYVTCYRFYDCVDYIKRSSYIFNIDKVNFIERVTKKDDKIVREKVKRF